MRSLEDIHVPQQQRDGALVASPPCPCLCPSLGCGVTGGESSVSTHILLAPPLPHGLGAWQDNYTSILLQSLPFSESGDNNLFQRPRVMKEHNLAFLGKLTGLGGSGDASSPALLQEHPWGCAWGWGSHRALRLATGISHSSSR